jgi:hypothetical protein
MVEQDAKLVIEGHDPQLEKSSWSRARTVKNTRGKTDTAT